MREVTGILIKISTSYLLMQRLQFILSSSSFSLTNEAHSFDLVRVSPKASRQSYNVLLSMFFKITVAGSSRLKRCGMFLIVEWQDVCQIMRNR